jgi:hypothetical protein
VRGSTSRASRPGQRVAPDRAAAPFPWRSRIYGRPARSATPDIRQHQTFSNTKHSGRRSPDGESWGKRVHRGARVATIVARMPDGDLAVSMINNSSLDQRFVSAVRFPLRTRSNSARGGLTSRRRTRPSEKSFPSTRLSHRQMLPGRPNIPRSQWAAERAGPVMM